MTNRGEHEALVISALQKMHDRLTKVESVQGMGGDAGQGGGEDSGQVVTREEYHEWDDDRKADFLDAHGVEGLQALLRGESVELPNE